jgi:hypothetical protein
MMGDAEAALAKAQEAKDAMFEYFGCQAGKPISEVFSTLGNLMSGLN